MGRWLRRVGLGALVMGGFLVLAALVWQGLTGGGNPNPTAAHLSRGTAILDSGILVFREGLEAILVLAAITASFQGAQAAYRKPVAAGVGAGLLATVATWFVAIAIIGAVNAPALDIQAATGLLAIAVLLVVMNWFFHKVYWTGWIGHHNQRRRRLLAIAGDDRFRALLGFGLLGFTAMYREGFEVVLFLQNLRLQAGSSVVLQGVALGMAGTAIVGAITFLAQRRMPYKQMLVVTGVMLGFVLVVMVGESAQELQLAGWLPIHTLPLPLPGWTGLWFAVFPTLETLCAQFLAATLVIGSYVAAQEIRVRGPRRRAAHQAARPTRQATTPAHAPMPTLHRSGE